MTERKHTRYNVELAAEVEIGGEPLLAATRNLSRGGVCIDVERALSDGAVLGLSLFLTLEGIEEAGSDTLSVQARVVWCTEREDGRFTAGLQFGTLSSGQQGTIDELLRRLSD